ncbi:MAG: hypothetical protein IPM25_14865 [Chloracidobacterium sp.]|nr:hypothetical protein [Chloracidobacterium sp.]
MRWLEKSYARVLSLFKSELTEKFSLKPDEVEICLGLATKDLSGSDLFSQLSAG